jgi:hypothetical protein
MQHDTATDAAPAAGTAARGLLASASKGVGKAGKSVGKAMSGFGSLFKAAPKPPPPQAMELTDFRSSSVGHRKSLSSSTASSTETTDAPL